MRQKRLSHMMMPANPRARFILIHADFTFSFFESGFDRSTLTAHVCQHLRRDAHWCIAQSILRPGWFTQTSSEDSPNTRPGQEIANGRDPQPCRVCNQCSLPPFLNRQALPFCSGQAGREFALFLSKGRIQPGPRTYAESPQQAGAGGFHHEFVQPHACIAGQLSEIPFFQRCGAVQKTRILDEMLITHDSLEREHGSYDQVARHLQGQLRLSAKRSIVWDTTGPLARLMAVIKPILRQIQAAIQKRVTLQVGVNHEHAFLTIRNLVLHPAILTCDARRVFTLFRKPTAVDNDYAGGMPQRHRYQSLMAANQICCIPLVCAHELLNGSHGIEIRPHQLQLQHHRLNGVAFHLRQLPAQMQRRPVPLLSSIEAALKQTVIVGQCLANHFLILGRHLDAHWSSTGRWLIVTRRSLFQRVCHDDPLFEISSWSVSRNSLVVTKVSL